MFFILRKLAYVQIAISIQLGSIALFLIFIELAFINPTIPVHRNAYMITKIYLCHAFFCYRPAPGIFYSHF